MIDIWRPGRGFVMNGKHLFEEDFMNMQGRVLRTTAFDFAPFTTSRPGSEKFDGIEVEI